MSLTIHPDLQRAAPNLILGCVQARVVVTKHDDTLWSLIDSWTSSVSMTTETLSHMAPVEALRQAYKALGKDPSRYRSSAESLVRRVLQGKGLYQVNTIVDINNLISMQSLHSVGSYDLNKLTAPLQFRVGLPNESYKGIGKEMINIAELPVFADAHGPFGSPTSDSERAMILLSTTDVLMVVIAFDGDLKIEEHMNRCVDLLKVHASATSIETSIVR